VYTVLCGRPHDDGPAKAVEKLLDDAERARASRFRFASDRRDFVVAHALLRIALSNESGVPPRHWRLSYDSYGKPSISAPDGFSRLLFNLSHTKGLVACAVTDGVPVGVDVEQVRLLDDLLDVARQFFARAEVIGLEHEPEELRYGRFFDIWTLKESYIKARGLGVSLPLERFSFEVGTGGAIPFSVDPELGDDASAWQFGLRSVSSAYRLAYALARGGGPDLAVEFRDMQCVGELESSLHAW
jgi:4'-phosphopantetheinyl transferase